MTSGNNKSCSLQLPAGIEAWILICSMMQDIGKFSVQSKIELNFKKPEHCLLYLVIILYMQAAAQKVQEVRDITRIERIGKLYTTGDVLLNEIRKSLSYKLISVLYFLLLIGAHSHIRGLGLDDALEARQVRRMFFPCFNCEYSNVGVHDMSCTVCKLPS